MNVVTIGELMLRLTPPRHERFVQAESFEAVYGGGEANTAVSLSCLGDQAVFVTKLPAHAVGQAAVDALRRYGVDTRHIVRGGERIGIYFMERGADRRPSDIIYDRAHSAFAESSEEEYDWSAIFAHADWLHLTGITPALGKSTAALALRAIHEAKKRNIPVSFDVNYRAKLWSEEEARPVLTLSRRFPTSSSPTSRRRRSFSFSKGGTTKPSPPRSGRSTAAKRLPSPSAAR